MSEIVVFLIIFAGLLIYKMYFWNEGARDD